MGHVGSFRIFPRVVESEQSEVWRGSMVQRGQGWAGLFEIFIEETLAEQVSSHADLKNISIQLLCNADFGIGIKMRIGAIPSI